MSDLPESPAVARALALFRSPPARLNCAQTVRAALDPTTADAPTVEELRPFGGGRAPGGTCGALHTAELLLADRVPADHVRALFLERAGEHRCRQLRSEGNVTCHGCVALAVELVERLGGAEARDPDAFVTAAE